MPAQPFGGLIERATTLEARLAFSVGLIAVLVLVGWVASRLRHQVDLRSRNLERVVNAAFALGLFVLALAVGGAVMTLWSLEPFAAVGVTDPLVVLGQTLISVAIVLTAYVATGVLKRTIHGFTQDRASITPHQTEVVYRSSQLLIYGLVVLVIFGIWGVDLGGLLVGAGFLGIVIGLAARQTLGSLIAGFVLMFARPFEIGDWVQIGEREGIVTEISIVNTRIQTFDGEYAMIPNDMVGGSEVINRTRKGRLRIQLTVAVDYDTDLERAMEIAVDAMGDVDDVLAVPQPQAVLEGFDDSAVVLNLRFWIDKPSARRKWRAQTAVVASVKSAFEDAGITIPFPQRVVSSRSAGGRAEPMDLGPTEGGGSGSTDGPEAGEDARPTDG